MCCYILTVSFGVGCTDTSGVHLQQQLYYPAFSTGLENMVNWLTLGEDWKRQTPQHVAAECKALFSSLIWSVVNFNSLFFFCFGGDSVIKQRWLAVRLAFVTLLGRSTLVPGLFWHWVSGGLPACWVCCEIVVSFIHTQVCQLSARLWRFNWLLDLVSVHFSLKIWL